MRLGISLKSLLKNLRGSVPNRIDDLMGEMANVQLWSPEIVTGYVMFLNAEDDSVRKADGLSWSQFFVDPSQSLDPFFDRLVESST